MPKSENLHHLGFEAQLEKTVITGFEAKPEKTVIACFDAIPSKIIAAGFEAKPTETVAAGFETKPLETVQVVLMLNHSQTVDLDFKAQPRNSRSSSPRAWCRPHTAPPDLSIVRLLSTRPVRPFPVLCIRSPTPATTLIAARHVTPATCTPRDK
jgi:hypothetical protein